VLPSIQNGRKQAKPVLTFELYTTIAQDNGLGQPCTVVPASEGAPIYGVSINAETGVTTLVQVTSFAIAS